jgi:hypothetical protein
MANDLAIAANDFAFCYIGEGNLVALRDLLDQPQTARELSARMQASAVRDDRDVIVRMHADVERLCGDGLHVESLVHGRHQAARSCAAIKVKPRVRSSGT